MALNKEDFRKLVAEQFLDVINKDPLHWSKGWVDLSKAKNGVSDRVYSGANQFLLGMKMMMNGWDDPRFYTTSQLQKLVNDNHLELDWKGQRATPIEYWFWKDLTKKRGEPNRYLTFSEYNDLIESGKRNANEFVLTARYYYVFNAKQIIGLPEYEKEELPNQDIKQDELINVLSDAMGVPIAYGGDRAYYVPADDRIQLPNKEQFYSEYEFNATALHELGHSTGHPDRLNRDLKNFFGSEDYAFEELVAEMTSCFMSVYLKGNEDDVNAYLDKHGNNHLAYVQSWNRALKDKPNLLFNALKLAEQATSYMEMKANLITKEEYKDQEVINNVIEKPKVKTMDHTDNV